MADLAKIEEQLSSLTLMQAAELVKMLEEKWGVSAAAPVAVAAAAAPAAGGLKRNRKILFRNRSSLNFKMALAFCFSFRFCAV